MHKMLVGEKKMKSKDKKCKHKNKQAVLGRRFNYNDYFIIVLCLDCYEEINKFWTGSPKSPDY